MKSFYVTLLTFNISTVIYTIIFIVLIAIIANTYTHHCLYMHIILVPTLLALYFLDPITAVTGGNNKVSGSIANIIHDYHHNTDCMCLHIIAIIPKYTLRAGIAIVFQKSLQCRESTKQCLLNFVTFIAC